MSTMSIRSYLPRTSITVAVSMDSLARCPRYVPRDSGLSMLFTICIQLRIIMRLLIIIMYSQPVWTRLPCPRRRNHDTVYCIFIHKVGHCLRSKKIFIFPKIPLDTMRPSCILCVSATIVGAEIFGASLIGERKWWPKRLDLYRSSKMSIK